MAFGEQNGTLRDVQSEPLQASSTAAIEAWLHSASTTDPHAAATQAADRPPSTALRATFACTPYWLAPNAQPYTRHAWLVHDAEGLRALITHEPVEASSQAEAARISGAVLLDLAQPLPLYPVHVDKPWGQEIWFSGVEARGVSLVGHPSAGIPLPELLALAPEWICRGRERELILLKILAPHADPDFGQLYFELHERKREAYVVLNVDAAAWPQGTGEVRVGFDAARRQQLGDEGLRTAFADAVAAYEATRREIDAVIDDLQANANVAPGSVLPLQQARALLAQVPAHLQARELQQRNTMQAFTSIQSLRAGDVLNLPTHVPHALQHGVRVVEFQTPTFERRILYFTQKVHTQPDWDTAQAIAMMKLDAPQLQRTSALTNAGEVFVETIVDFPDFRVLRVHLPARSDASARQTPSCFRPPATDYALCMCIDGEIAIGRGRFGREQACLVPAVATALAVENCGNAGTVFLWAIPK